MQYNVHNMECIIYIIKYFRCILWNYWNVMREKRLFWIQKQTGIACKSIVANILYMCKENYIFKAQAIIMIV